MRIGIDISLTIGEKAGVGYYCANLMDALAKIDLKKYVHPIPFFIIHTIRITRMLLNPLKKLSNLL